MQVCINRMKTTLPYRQGEEPTVYGALMITTTTYLGTAYTNTHDAEQNFQIKTLSTMVFG
jgi:hypothetical protein